jgi:hypothetical protein
MGLISNRYSAAGWRGQSQADWRSTLARVGLSAKGILYLAIGLLAINVASGDASSSAVTQRGAAELVANQPLGQALIVILTVGLFAMAAWQFTLAITGDPVEGSVKSDRVKYAAKGVAYLATAMAALPVMLAQWGASFGMGANGDGQTERRAAAEIMTWPAGPWIAAALGLAIIAIGVYQLHHHALHKRFMQRLDRGKMRPEIERGIEHAGQAGYAARGMVFAIVGIFFVLAAVQHDPREAVGLAGALQALSDQTWGQLVLWAVAIGLFLFGCFSFAEAKYRRATWRLGPER